jgi:prepilin-type N-terminal cleavage/methylation domain-containing protein
MLTFVARCGRTGIAATLRHGLSLAELLVVVAVMGIAAGALGRVAVLQQSRYRELSFATQARGQLRHGAELLAAELRGVSAVGGDIYPNEMHDASIAVRATTGSYVLCAPPARGSSDLLVASLDAPGGREAVADPPSAGDSLWLYDTGTMLGGSDDSWRAHLITAAGPVSVPCVVDRHAAVPSRPTADDTADSAATARRSYRVSIQPPPSSAVDEHAPARVFRRVRYALYRSSDGEWYLGYSDCRPLVRAPACSTIQPVSGPYLPYSAPGTTGPSGLTLSYFDSSGGPTSDRLAVARIEIVLRARTALREKQTATVQVSAALRNRR